MSNETAYAQSIERANALMDELQELAARAVSSDVMSEEDFRAFDPYQASEALVIIDNAVIDAGRVTDNLLAQADGLVDQLTSDVERFHVALGDDTTARNKTVVLTTLGVGVLAVSIVGLLAYYSREK